MRGRIYRDTLVHRGFLKPGVINISLRNIFVTWVNLGNCLIQKHWFAFHNLSLMTIQSGNSKVSNHDSFYQLLEFKFCCCPEVKEVNKDHRKYRENRFRTNSRDEFHESYSMSHTRNKIWEVLPSNNYEMG